MRSILRLRLSRSSAFGCQRSTLRNVNFFNNRNLKARFSTSSSHHCSLTALCNRALKGDDKAQLQLGRAYLFGGPETNEDELAQTRKRALTSEASTVDDYGRPTGGANSAKEVVQTIKAKRKAAKLAKAKLSDSNKARKKSSKLPKQRIHLFQKDIRIGEFWLQHSAQQGNKEAMVQLGNLRYSYMEKSSSATENSKNLKKAIEYYLNSIEEPHPHPDGLYNLGIIFYDGVDGLLEPNRERAFSYLMRAANDLHDPSAMFWIGQLGLTAEDSSEFLLRPNEVESFRLVKEAAERGHGVAMVYLFKFLLQVENIERFGILKDEVEDVAMSYLERAVRLQEPEALHLKADMLFGEDNPKALQLYTEAGHGGIASAWISAGAMHYHGFGTQKSYIDAYRSYEKAAELGSIEAWKNIASMYYSGEGVVKCVDTATRILELLQAQTTKEE